MQRLKENCLWCFITFRKLFIPSAWWQAHQSALKYLDCQVPLPLLDFFLNFPLFLIVSRGHAFILLCQTNRSLFHFSSQQAAYWPLPVSFSLNSVLETLLLKKEYSMLARTPGISLSLSLETFFFITPNLYFFCYEVLHLIPHIFCHFQLNSFQLIMNFLITTP